METYQRGRTEPHSKCGCRGIGTWVRIPPSPPKMNCSHPKLKMGVNFSFYMIVLDFGLKDDIIFLYNNFVGGKVMSRIIEMIKTYQPFNEQEEKDKQFFINCENKEQILTRENELAHLCASAFVVNKERTKVLCTYHKIFDSWTWTGGHIDGVDDALFVAEKELKEETSLQNFKLLSTEPISIESIPVLSHMKGGKFVSAHVHLNVTYLFEADENDTIKMKEDENSGVKWLTFAELMELSSEKYMLPIYTKIIEKMKQHKL